MFRSKTGLHTPVKDLHTNKAGVWKFLFLKSTSGKMFSLIFFLGHSVCLFSYLLYPFLSALDGHNSSSSNISSSSKYLGKLLEYFTENIITKRASNAKEK